MRLSVALCTCNGARFLPEQLDSLARQTRLPDELVVTDDCSDDASPHIVSRFAATAPFPVYVHVNERRLGTTSNFARAITLCSGDVIFLCDQDDVWHSSKCARFENEFSADPRIGLICSDAEVVRADGSPAGFRLWDTLPFTPRMLAAFNATRGARELLRYNLVTGAAAAFRTHLRPLLLPIPVDWFHDAWIGFLATAVAPALAISEPLIGYRRHAQQQVGAAPRTLARQWRAARNQDATELRRTVLRFEQLVTRLRSLEGSLLDPELIARTEQKVAHSCVRWGMRSRCRASRLVSAVCELARGNYHRFGRGLRGFATDVLL